MSTTESTTLRARHDGSPEAAPEAAPPESGEGLPSGPPPLDEQVPRLSGSRHPAGGSAPEGPGSTWRGNLRRGCRLGSRMESEHDVGSRSPGARHALIPRLRRDSSAPRPGAVNPRRAFSMEKSYRLLGRSLQPIRSPEHLCPALCRPAVGPRRPTPRTVPRQAFCEIIPS